MGVLGRFRQDRRGTVAVMFGLALVPLGGLVGAAIDYGRASQEQTKLQRAMDATALALTRMPRTATQGDLQTRANEVFGTLYQPPAYVSMNPMTVQRTANRIELSRNGSVTNAMMQLVGIPATQIGTQARAASSSERIELALVLDNTGSMAELVDGTRKIDALKTAAADLLSRLRALAADRDDVRVSLVPFDTEVRVDPNTYRYRDWIRWQDRSSIAERLAWTGYLVDRYQPNDVKDVAPDTVYPDTLYTKPPAGSQWAAYGQLASVRPLASIWDTAQYNALTSTISAMQPRGNTNVGLGVVWGVGTLTGSIPLDTVPSTDPRTVRRFMVVLTDGTNTEKWVDGQPCTPGGPGCRISVNQMDARTSAACTMAKDPAGANIEVFTIRLLDGSVPLLSGCASPANPRVAQHYFDVQSRPALDAAFKAILDAIGKVRITS